LSLNNAHEGYDYQDLITSYFILKEVLVGNLDSVFSIDRKNTTTDVPDRFDDLVIINGTNVERKQIKYSNDETSKVLIKDYLSSDSTYSIALHKLFLTWRDLNTPDSEFRLCLAWGEAEDENITRVLKEQDGMSSFYDFPTKVFKINLDRLWEESPENFNRWNSLRTFVKEENISRSEFNRFCNDLLIEVELPKASLKFKSPGSLEVILIEQAKRLGIEQYPNHDVYISDFLERLAKLVGVFRTRSTQIAAKDILIELRVKTDFGKIEQTFEIDQSKNINSHEKNELFIEEVVKNKKTLLIGEPGAGKSWFLTNLIEYLNSKEQAVIRHYCFTGTEDSLFAERVSSNVFFGNLISDIESYFPDLKMSKHQLYASNLKELNLLLANIKEPLIIIIDGLDHIERVLQTSATLSKQETRIIELISEIQLPPHVNIILGSQPTIEIEQLVNESGFHKLQIPKWEIAETEELMAKFECENIQVEEQCLSSILHNKCEGSPLYLTYILKTLNEHETVTFELVDNLPEYDFNLEKYYEYLTKQLGNNITAEILSCLEFSVTQKELKEITPIPHHFNRDMKVLSPVIIENSSRGGVKLYHDSFRRFNIEKLSSIPDHALNTVYGYIVSWLCDKGFYENDKSYRYLLHYLNLSEQHHEVTNYAEGNFLPDSLYFGHSESIINKNYNNFLLAAEKLQDWSLFAYAGELRRAIVTTNSEEHHSQFLDNFDLYFEAICSIYGCEKANALLFFNGEKNYSDKVTAQGFKILQTYGYKPAWEEVGELFENKISLENFEYFLCYQIQENENLNEILARILSGNHFKFLNVFVSEIYKQIGFSEIESCYQELKEDVDGKIAKRINSTLASLNCIQRIPDKVNCDSSQLKPLDMSFTDEYIEVNKVEQFLFNVKQHAKNDIDTLIKFEKGIPSSNFFYVWVKYFIRALVIESKSKKEPKEQHVVDNIKFLTMDTSSHIGETRVVDFHYSCGGLIEFTIVQSLKFIKSKEAWDEVTNTLTKIPFNAISIIEKEFLDENNIHAIISKYEEFESSRDEDYSAYAEYAFKKAIYQGRLNNVDKAKEELRKALKLITSYTYRKDTTLSEIIEPLSSLNMINPSFAQQSCKRLKFLTDAVMKHTEDGKDTRWLTINWFEKLYEVDEKTASLFLINEFIVNGLFWKLDYMFVYYLNNSKQVDPVILNFLYKLSPTNNRDNYLNGFLDVIEKVEVVDAKLAEQSLINLSTRDWNDSYNSLNTETEIKFHQLMKRFDVECPIRKKKSEKTYDNNTQSLSDLLSNQLCQEDSLRALSKDELQEYFNNKERLNEKELNLLYFYLLEEGDDELAIEFLLPIIRVRFPTDSENHYRKLRELIDQLPLSEETKIHLHIENFAFSKDGWFSSFVEKESLKNAILIDKEKSLFKLSEALVEIYSNSKYLYKYASNLIVAFEYAGLNHDAILRMYERSYDFIENRLPSTSEFKWENVESHELRDMGDDELAISMILSKSENLDSYVQREIIGAINYIMIYKASLLVRPLKWFFINAKRFHQLGVAAILNLLLCNIDEQQKLIKNIEAEVMNCSSLDNLYIQQILQELGEGLESE